MPEAMSPPVTGEVGDMSWLSKLMPSRIRTQGTGTTFTVVTTHDVAAAQRLR